MEDKGNVKEKTGYRELFRQKEYRKILLAGLINRFGDSIDAIAFTWLVYELTGNAAWSAFMFAANQLPSVLVQPFAGALVEGMEKKKLMVITDIIRGMITAGLALLYSTGLLTPWIMLIFTLVNSSVEAFRLPASLAVMPMILKEKDYAYGSSLNSGAGRIVELMGLGAAGVIIGFWGIGTAIAIDGVSFFGSALILSFLRIKENHLRKGQLSLKEYGTSLKDGWSYLKGQKVIRNFCLLTVLVNAITVPLNALQTPLIQEVLGQGSQLLSVFSLALSAGMGIGSLAYPFVSRRLSVRVQFAGAGVLVGASMYSYTFGMRFQSHVPAIYALTILNSFLLGMAVSILMSVLSVQFMKAVKQEYLARVGAIFNAGASAAVPAASLLVSVWVSFSPVSQIFKLSGLICVIMFLAIAFLKVRLE